MSLSTIVIIGQTGMKCRKNRKNVKLRHIDDICLEIVVKYPVWLGCLLPFSYNSYIVSIFITV